MARCKKSTVVYLLLSLCLSGIFTFCFFSARMQREWNNTLYPNVIRLHVVASDNEKVSQELKYAVKDRVVDYVAALTRYCRNETEAEHVLTEHLCDIDAFAKAQSVKLGGDGKVKTSFGEEYYTVRTFCNMTFPGGKYKSLRIMLGEAKGKNWWCVLYPNLCDAVATDEAENRLKNAGVSDDSAEAVCRSKDYAVCFYFLELLENLADSAKS